MDPSHNAKNQSTAEQEGQLQVDHLHPHSRGITRTVETNDPDADDHGGTRPAPQASTLNAVLLRAEPGMQKRTGDSQQQDRQKRMKVAEARMKGYEGDPCGACGAFTLVRNGTCLKCISCGGTSGCS